MTELAKSFEPAAIEARWGPAVGSQAAPHAPTLDPARPSFCIQLPPPNVTGTLHMGHAFNQTIMDALTRYHRMRGYNTLWLPGTDHAGIATQIVVERQLQEQTAMSRHDLGPQELRRPGVGVESTVAAPPSPARCAAWATASTGRASTSRWTRSCRAVVTETFVRLYDEGLIYRGKRLVNWDPVLKTAVSDLEVESEEEDGFLWHIRYPLVATAAATRRWWPPRGPRPCSATSR